MRTETYASRLKHAMAGQLVLSPGVDAIIRNDEGHILLMRRSDGGTWDLPGGAVEPGETPSAALRREVREETGLEVEIIRVAGVFGGSSFRHVYPDGQEVEGFSVTFECRIVGGRLENVDGEATAFEFVPAERLPPLTWPYPRELFETTRQGCLYL